MKKRGFITIFVLLLLLVLSITISFIFGQNQNDLDLNEDLYDKKQALYISESVANLALKDRGFDEYKEKLYKSIKDYYRNSKYFETKIEEDKVGRIKSYYPEINYYGKIYKPKFSYIPAMKTLRLESSVNIGETQAKTLIDNEVKPKFEFFKEEPIKYDFKEEIKFRTLNLIEDPDIIELELNNKENFYKINDSLIIEEVNKNNEEEEPTKEETSDENIDFEDENDKNSDKFDQENIKENSVDETSTEQKNANFKGIIYVKGDLILKSDFSMDGLLILDGKVINKSNNKDKNSKLTLKGQVISREDLEKENLDYNYDKESYKYIEDIDNLFEIETISKKVY